MYIYIYMLFFVFPILLLQGPLRLIFSKGSKRPTKATFPKNATGFGIRAPGPVMENPTDKKLEN